MPEHHLVGLTSIVFLGLLAQWLAWRTRLPAILLLLIFGFAAGATQLFDSDQLMGDLLFPVVSLSVALILFEGGLSLRLSELREIHQAVRNLITVGAAVTWGTTALAARFILELDWAYAILLGAILIVTGPTVVGPLLRHVRPLARVGSLAKWEGITIDPIGAILAVLVFEAILLREEGQLGWTSVFGLFEPFLAGLVLGVIGAAFVYLMLKNYWLPDFLHSAFTLAVVVTAFTAANLLAGEAGLVTVTVMGVALANQRSATVHHIIEFKESLRVLLISSVFILLASRMKLEDLTAFGWQGVAFLAALFVVVRPASVFLSTLGTPLNWRERVFLSWLAPRGIVAAAVASVFSLRLAEAGHQEAATLAPLTFLVIVATATVYGLTTRPLALMLKLTQQHPNGFLILGAHAWARQIAQALSSKGFQVMLADTNRENVLSARLAGLGALHGNILTEPEENLNLSGIGRMLALTANDEANSLACLHFRDDFGRQSVYQLPVHQQDPEGHSDSHHLRGRILFGRDLTHKKLNGLSAQGLVVKATGLTDSFSYRDYRQLYGENVILLFRVGADGIVQAATSNTPLRPAAGDVLIGLVQEKEKQANG